MSWTFDKTAQDWLGGSRLAVAPEAVVEAFHRVERMLGREWIERSRIHSGIPAQGSSPTLHVVVTGQTLASLEGVAGAEKLIERHRQDDQSADAELTAIHLLRSRRMTEIELYPKISVGNREREPDFRIRRPDEPWIYIEVTQPDVSQVQKRAQSVLLRLTGLVESVKKSFALEVFLRREPTDVETESLAKRVLDICLAGGTFREDLLAGLGLLLLNRSQPGRVILEDHPGEENHPRLGMVTTIVGPDEPHRHIAVRVAFADERAEDFLRGEARQLPEDAPGLIMVQMSRAPGGFKSWEPLLRRRFQPALYTRVCGVCLFSSGLVGTAEGEAWLPQTKLLVNPHARLALPFWIPNALKEAGSQFEQFVEQPAATSS